MNAQTTPIYSTPQSFSMIGSVANISSVTMVTPGVDTNYVLYGTLVGAAAGSGGTCTLGTVNLRLGYTDADGGVAVLPSAGTSNIALQTILASTILSSSLTVAASLSGTTIAKLLPTTFRAKSGVAVILFWDEGASSNCSTPPVIELRPVLVAIGG